MGGEYRDDLKSAHEAADHLRDENAELRQRLGEQPLQAAPWIAPTAPPKAPLSQFYIWMGIFVAIVGVLAMLSYVRAQQYKALNKKVQRQVIEASGGI